MTRRKQHRTIGYYVWRIVLAFALVGGIFYYAPKIYARFQYLPIDKILANCNGEELNIIIRRIVLMIRLLFSSFIILPGLL